MLDMVMVKQFIDIFIDKESAIIADDLMGDAKSTNYMLMDEIYNCGSGGFLQWDCLNPLRKIFCSY